MKVSDPTGVKRVKFRRLKHRIADAGAKLPRAPTEMRSELVDEGVDTACHFRQTLVYRRRQMDDSTVYNDYWKVMMPLSRSLAETLYHVDAIVETTISHIRDLGARSPALFSMLAAIAALARDLGVELVPHFPRIMDVLVELAIDAADAGSAGARADQERSRRDRSRPAEAAMEVEGGDVAAEVEEVKAKAEVEKEEADGSSSGSDSEGGSSSSGSSSSSDEEETEAATAAAAAAKEAAAAALEDDEQTLAARRERHHRSMIALTGPERTGEVFRTMLLVFKYLSRGLVEDLAPVERHFGTLLGHAKPYVRQFAAKTFSFLLRKLKGAALGKGLKRVVSAVGRTCIANAAAGVKGAGSSADPLIDGGAALLFETLRNVQSHLHGDVATVLPVVLRSALPATGAVSAHVLAACFEVNRQVIRRLARFCGTDAVAARPLWTALEVHLSEVVSAWRSLPAATSEGGIHDVALLRALQLWLCALQQKKGALLDSSGETTAWQPSQMRRMLRGVLRGDGDVLGRLIAGTKRSSSRSASVAPPSWDTSDVATRNYEDELAPLAVDASPSLVWMSAMQMCVRVIVAANATDRDSNDAQKYTTEWPVQLLEPLFGATPKRVERIAPVAEWTLRFVAAHVFADDVEEAREALLPRALALSDSLAAISGSTETARDAAALIALQALELCTHPDEAGGAAAPSTSTAAAAAAKSPSATGHATFGLLRSTLIGAAGSSSSAAPAREARIWASARCWSLAQFHPSLVALATSAERVEVFKALSVIMVTESGPNSYSLAAVLRTEALVSVLATATRTRGVGDAATLRDVMSCTDDTRHAMRVVEIVGLFHVVGEAMPPAMTQSMWNRVATSLSSLSHARRINSMRFLLHCCTGDEGAAVGEQERQILEMLLQIETNAPVIQQERVTKTQLVRMKALLTTMKRSSDATAEEEKGSTFVVRPADIALAALHHTFGLLTIRISRLWPLMEALLRHVAKLWPKLLWPALIAELEKTSVMGQTMSAKLKEEQHAQDEDGAVVVSDSTAVSVLTALAGAAQGSIEVDGPVTSRLRSELAAQGDFERDWDASSATREDLRPTDTPTRHQSMLNTIRGMPSESIAIPKPWDRALLNLQLTFVQSVFLPRHRPILAISVEVEQMISSAIESVVSLAGKKSGAWVAPKSPAAMELDYGLSGKPLRTALMSYIGLFEVCAELRQGCRVLAVTDAVHTILMTLLEVSDDSIGLLALRCLLKMKCKVGAQRTTWGVGLRQKKEVILQLAQPRFLRDAMVRLTLLPIVDTDVDGKGGASAGQYAKGDQTPQWLKDANSAKAEGVADEWRREIIPVITRLMLGYMFHSTGVGSARNAHELKARRATALGYLSLMRPAELTHPTDGIVALATRQFRFASAALAPETVADASDARARLESVTKLLEEGHTVTKANPMAFDAKHMMFLHFAMQLTQQLGETIVGRVHWLAIPTIAMLKHALQSRHGAGGGASTRLGKMRRAAFGTLHAMMRQFPNLDGPHTVGWADLFEAADLWTELAPILKDLPRDMANAEKPSILLRLIELISLDPKLCQLLMTTGSSKSVDPLSAALGCLSDRNVDTRGESANSDRSAGVLQSVYHIIENLLNHTATSEEDVEGGTTSDALRVSKQLVSMHIPTIIAQFTYRFSTHTSANGDVLDEETSSPVNDVDDATKLREVTIARRIPKSSWAVRELAILSRLAEHVWSLSVAGNPLALEQLAIARLLALVLPFGKHASSSPDSKMNVMQLAGRMLPLLDDDVDAGGVPTPASAAADVFAGRVCRFLSAMLGIRTLKGRCSFCCEEGAQRASVIAVLVVLAKRRQLRSWLAPTIALLSDLNAFSDSRVEGYDFELRMGALAKIIRLKPAAGALDAAADKEDESGAAEHSLWASEEWQQHPCQQLLVVHQCLFTMHEAEVGMRSAALQAVGLLLQHTASCVRTKTDDGSNALRLVANTVMAAIHTSLLSDRPQVWRSFVSLFAELLSTFNGISTVAQEGDDTKLLESMHLDLLPMLSLGSSGSLTGPARESQTTDEPPTKQRAQLGINFFVDIVNIQAHRRARALQRLSVALMQQVTSSAAIEGEESGDDGEDAASSAETSNAFEVSQGSARHMMLPIILHCVTENAAGMSKKAALGEVVVSNGYGQGTEARSFTDSTSVREEALPVLRALASRLGWAQWQALLRRLHTQLQRCASIAGEDSLLERSLVRGVCAVSDAWHFDLTNKVIMRALQNRVIPSLQKLVLKNNDKKTSGLSGSGNIRQMDHVRDGGRKGGKGLRIKMVHAITKLVLHMSGDKRAQSRILKSVLGDVCNMLRSKAQSIRDDARTTLAHVATSVGIRSLPLILYNLGAVLKKKRNRYSKGTAGGGGGFDSHVLSHSTFSVLEALELCGALEEKREEPVVEEEDAAKEEGEEEEEKEEVELVDETELYRAIPFLSELVMKDIFGAAAQDRARGVANEYKSKHGKIREMHSSKGLAIFELVCRHIKFKPNDALERLLQPLTHQVYVSVSTAAHAQTLFETSGLGPRKRLNKVEELMQRGVAGLLKNTNVRLALPELLQYVKVHLVAHMSSDLGLKITGVLDDDGAETDDSSDEDDSDDEMNKKLKIGFVQDDGSVTTGLEETNKSGKSKRRGAAARNARAAKAPIPTWSADNGALSNTAKGKKKKLLERKRTALDAVIVHAEPRLMGLGHTGRGATRRGKRRSADGSESADREYRRLMAQLAANLLCGALRARFFKSGEDSHRALLDPLQLLLARCACAASRRPLKDGSAEVTSKIRAIRSVGDQLLIHSLQGICILASWPLPSRASVAPLVVEELLRLLGKHGNGSAQPIVQSCFLALSRLLRVPVEGDGKKKKGGRRKKGAASLDDTVVAATPVAADVEGEDGSNAELLAAIPSSVWGRTHDRKGTAPKMKTILKSRQLRVLIRYIRASLDIRESGSGKRQTKKGASIQSRQSRATFALLKSIVRSRLLVSEFYDLMGSLAELVFTSRYDSVRRDCTRVLLQYLLHYPMGAKRLQQHMELITKNLGYPIEGGRSSALDLLHAVILKFPKEVMLARGEVLLLALVQRLAAESSTDVRVRAAIVLKLLLARCQPDSRSSTSSRAVAGSSGSATAAVPLPTTALRFASEWMRAAQPEIRAVGAQLLVTVIETCPDFLFVGVTRGAAAASKGGKRGKKKRKKKSAVSAAAAAGGGGIEVVSFADGAILPLAVAALCDVVVPVAEASATSEDALGGPSASAMVAISCLAAAVTGEGDIVVDGPASGNEGPFEAGYLALLALRKLLELEGGPALVVPLLVARGGDVLTFVTQLQLHCIVAVRLAAARFLRTLLGLRGSSPALTAMLTTDALFALAKRSCLQLQGCGAAAPMDAEGNAVAGAAAPSIAEVDSLCHVVLSNLVVLSLELHGRDQYANGEGAKAPAASPLRAEHKGPLNWLYNRVCAMSRLFGVRNGRHAARDVASSAIAQAATFKWIAAMAVQIDASTTSKFMQMMLMPLVRTVQTHEQRNKEQEERRSASSRKRSYNDALNASAGRRMQGEDSRDANTELATEVMELLSKRYGSSVYLEGYAAVVGKIRAGRERRRQERTILAIRDPVAAAAEKQRRNDAKIRQKKRKVDQLRRAHGKVAADHSTKGVKRLKGEE